MPGETCLIRRKRLCSEVWIDLILLQAMGEVLYTSAPRLVAVPAPVACDRVRVIGPL